jgi:hypothetical protein
MAVKNRARTKSMVRYKYSSLVFVDNCVENFIRVNCCELKLIAYVWRTKSIRLNNTTMKKYSKLQVATFYTFIGSAAFTAITIIALIYKLASVLFGFQA